MLCAEYSIFLRCRTLFNMRPYYSDSADSTVKGLSHSATATATPSEKVFFGDFRFFDLFKTVLRSF